MNTRTLQESLAATPFAGKLHHFASIHSTNSHALQQAASGAPACSVYYADEQTAGRGRGAHQWHSEPGAGLYVSVLLRPQLTAIDSLWLSLAAGLAAHDAVHRVCDAQADIRWPNDLMLGRRKFGGILTETQTDGDQLRHAVVGIGININHAAFPSEIAEVATSLRLATGRQHSRDELLAALLLALDHELTALETDRPRGAAILRRIEAASSWVRGKRVHVTEHDDDTGGYDGTTAGLDARGFLLVATAGTVRTVLSGGVREAAPS